jgi:archaellum biogenesis protein FlaJ (TadC family)
MKPDLFVTAATVLFGFLFAGFWWALNRELTFKPELRHFKPGYALLLASMALLATFGIVAPLGQITASNPQLIWTYRAVILVVIGIFGYMLTEFGHYGVFQWPKYTTWQEQLAFWSTTAVLLFLVVYWLSR